jgi:hypothetical protein
VLAEERSDRVESRRLWRMVLNACPGNPRGHLAWGNMTVKSEAPPARRGQPDALRFSKEGFRRHRQSHCKNETALASKPGFPLSSDSVGDCNI